MPQHVKHMPHFLSMPIAINHGGTALDLHAFSLEPTPLHIALSDAKHTRWLIVKAQALKRLHTC